MENAIERRLNWVGLPVIGTVAQLLYREFALQNEYPRLENRILKKKVWGRIRFTDEERGSLTEPALARPRTHAAAESDASREHRLSQGWLAAMIMS